MILRLKDKSLPKGPMTSYEAKIVFTVKKNPGNGNNNNRYQKKVTKGQENSIQSSITFNSVAISDYLADPPPSPNRGCDT